MLQELQRYPRTKMVLPLRVWLDEHGNETNPAMWAHTIDTCDVGCRIGGLRTELTPGQVITLQRGKHKAAFRVIWCRHLAANENQAGVEVLDQRTNIWVANPAANMPPAAAQTAGAVAASPDVAKLANSTVPKQRTVAATPHHMRLAVTLGLLLLSLAPGILLYHQIFGEWGKAALEPPAPKPPSAADLARLTPKGRPLPVLVSKPLPASPTRVQVAEAPLGHVVYPVGPESVTGKVRLQVVIAADGFVKQIHVLSGKQPLAEAAANAVRLWRYGSFQGPDPNIERETSVTVSFLGTDAVSLEFPKAHGNATLAKSN